MNMVIASIISTNCCNSQNNDWDMRCLVYNIIIIITYNHLLLQHNIQYWSIGVGSLESGLVSLREKSSFHKNTCSA